MSLGPDFPGLTKTHLKKISYHPYELVYHTAETSSQSKKRTGALLRFDFSELSGFADCHPWVEFGDAPLYSQLDMLKNGTFTRLSDRSLHFAILDAQARAKGVNLLEGLEIPKSHFLVTDIYRANDIGNALEKGFKYIKIKTGYAINRELAFLNENFSNLASKGIKLRLDFNAKLTCEEFEMFMGELQIPYSIIDFIEDPFPYHPELWSNIQDRYPVSLAYDHGSENAISDAAASVLILKPAVQDPRPFLQTGRRIVATSYLDHPLGQAAAAYTAAKICPKNEICGLLSHNVYQTNKFSECLPDYGPDFAVPAGNGFGFDDLLQSLEWKELC